MGTSFLPPPDIGGALAQLGEGIADIINPNAERERAIENMILANPEIGQGLAAAQREEQRRYEAQIQDPSIVADVDVKIAPPNVLGRYGMSQEKTEELLSPYPEDEAERLANFRREEGIAKLAAESEAEAFKAKISTDRIQSRLNKAKSDLNIPDLEAYSTLLKTDLDIDLTKEGKDRLSRWIQLTTELAESDDPKDQVEFRRLQFAMNSEAFLKDIQSRESVELGRVQFGEQMDLEKAKFREQKAKFGEQMDLERAKLSFQQSLAEIDAASDFADRQIKIQDLNFEAQDKVVTQRKLLNEALTEGTQEEITAAIVGMNNAYAQLRSLSPEGSSIAVDAKVGAGGFLWLGKKIKGVRVTVLAPGDMPITRRFQYEQFMDAFASADPGPEGITEEERARRFAEDMQLILGDPEGVRFVKSLTPEIRNKLFADAQRMHGAFELARRAEAAGVVSPEALTLEQERDNVEIARLELILEEGVEGGHPFRDVIDARKRIAKLKAGKRELKKFPGGVGG